MHTPQPEVVLDELISHHVVGEEDVRWGGEVS